MSVFPESETGMATRKPSGTVIQGLAKAIPKSLGGLADLTGTNKTEITDLEILTAANYTAKNIN